MSSAQLIPNDLRAHVTVVVYKNALFSTVGIVFKRPVVYLLPLPASRWRLLAWPFRFILTTPCLALYSI